MKYDLYDVVYVEDDREDWRKLEAAVKKMELHPPLRVKWAESPEKLEGLLSLSTRLVLADVYFSENTASGREEKARLPDIIKQVQAWTAKEGSSRPLPIIAYTGRGFDALKYCLDFKKDLYDIWDKSSASPEYAAWRLSEISKELSRIRPDALTQRLIREMQSHVGWHGKVVDMTKRYDAGWSEYDQIQRAGVAIEDIAYGFGVWGECGPMWKIMAEWEALSRAVSTKTRGHARHVINVFWLGYFLINHEYLRDIFTQYWKKIKDNRKNMEEVSNVDPIEALSNIWFYAGIFHDVGGAVEKSYKVSEYLKQLLSVFEDLAPPVTSVQKTNHKDFMKKARAWLNEFDESLVNLIEPVLEKSVRDNEPDQGVIAALHIRSKINKGKQGCYAREGARAMSMHNMFPRLGKETDTLPVTWSKEPLVCLLLLCDQLQTWDRERGTEALVDGDQPSRAELSSMEIVLDKHQKPHITMSIDYIVPAHLQRSLELYERVRDEFKKILRKNPYRALNKISKPWPFELHVLCTLSGEPLENMDFGAEGD